VTGEPFRPGFHFAPARNWLNDPNGLVRHDGEYHLFFQYNPHGCDWGNMSWGHAVSTDLVHWEELPVALTGTDTEHVFSGSAVVDHANTAGLGTGDGPPLVAVYTSHNLVTGGQAQSLAASTDRGRTWIRYEGNPVLDIGSTEFRDPKVFWYAEGGHWVMVVALAAERVVQLYRSADLKEWTRLSDFGPAGASEGLWECPDLFPLAVDGDPDDTRWVLLVSVQSGGPAGGSGTQYFVGDFDGVKFSADPAPGPGGVNWVDHGADFYAAVSFSGLADGERVLMGWMSNWVYAGAVPTREFRGSMALPRRLELRTVDGDVRLVQQPVAALQPHPAVEVPRQEVPAGVHPLPPEAHGSRLALVAEIEPGTARRCGLRVRVGSGNATVVGYDAAAGCVFVDRTRSGTTGFSDAFAGVHRAPYSLPGGLLRLEVYVDSASVEVFAGEGDAVLTDQIFPDPAGTGVELFAEAGGAVLHRLHVTPMTVTG